MAKIIVTGGDGQVGMELRKSIKNFLEFEAIFTDYKELDITDHQAVKEFFEAEKPDFVFNCAAFTAVDKAEEEVALAMNVNLDGASNLAGAAKDTGAKMIHISTDYVYDSHQNRPYVEGDETGPRSIYGISKLLGDKAVLQAMPDATILRTSWVYSSYGNNFVKTMLRLGREREHLRIVYDQIGTPTYAADLAGAMLQIARMLWNDAIQPKDAAGLFHFSNEGVASWYDFAKAIFEMEGIECKVEPILSKEYPTPARRPHFTLMDKGKIKRTFGLEIPYWRDSLRVCLDKLKK